MKLIEQRNNSVKVNKKMLVRLAENEDLTKKDYRILLYFFSYLDTSHFVYIPQKKICIDLFMEKSAVSKSIRNLLDLNIIEEGETESYNKGYRFKQIEYNFE